MIGKRNLQQSGLFDVGNVFDIALDPQSFHGQLARAASTLFQDADFASLYHARLGRPSVPPSQLALLTLLQHHAGVSDAEAIERSCWDARWAAVLGTPLGTPLCVKSTFQLFRSLLILHDQDLAIFQRSIQKAKEAGLLKHAPLRLALDTKPIFGRGAVEDTYNLLATGIRELCRAHAAVQAQPADVWAAAQDLRRYFQGSIKGSAAVDWADPEAKRQFLAEIVTDARRLLQITRLLLPTLPPADQEAVQAAARLLEQLLVQDVTEGVTPEGTRHVELKDGVTPGRVPSGHDPDQRHGRKSQSKRFTGHKATVGQEEASQIFVHVDVLSGDAPDATGVLSQVEQAEKNTGQDVASTTGDCAYGSGETRQEFVTAGRTLIAKVPQEPRNGDFFPKSRFVMDVPARTVTCPGGVISQSYTTDRQGGLLFSFGGHCATCPLRAQCTSAKGGRQVRVHPQEELLAQARAYQRTPEGVAVLRRRVVVEHGLARLSQLGIGQARYVGRRKTRFQLFLAATVANLRWTWNWASQNPRPDAPSDPSLLHGPTGGRFGTPRAATRREVLRSWCQRSVFFWNSPVALTAG